MLLVDIGSGQIKNTFTLIPFQKNVIVQEGGRKARFHFLQRKGFLS